jgi:acyl carrier protein
LTETESAICDLIVAEILNGEGDGLDADTPLIDLNILDSFKIMTLLAFIEKDLGVMITPEELGSETFGSIRNISAVIDAKKTG